MKYLFIGFTTLLLTACNNYGEKKVFGKGELYYTHNITADEADKAGSKIQETGYFTNDKAVSVQLDKTGDTYKLRFVVNEKAFSDTAVDFSFKFIATSVSQALSNAVVVPEMCDNSFSTKRIIQ